MADNLRRCMQCAYSLRDPGATPDQIIAGKVQHLCLEGPPTTIALPMNGALMTMTTYPLVNKDTISCRRWVAHQDVRNALMADAAKGSA